MPIGPPDSTEIIADRMIREAIESGSFEDLEGVGEPIPGAGRPDDYGWWIRTWVERNRTPLDQDPSKSS